MTHLTTREGLPSNEVYEVFQDSKGFIWFGTDRGVVKYDGSEMKVLTVKDGLSDPVVFGMSEDEQKRIWFRTYSGKISVYDNGKLIPYLWSNSIEEVLEFNLLNCLQSYDDNTFFATERFTGKISKDGILEKEEIKKNEINVTNPMDGILLYGFPGISTGVNKIKINGQYYPIALSDTVNHNKVICGIQDGNKTLISINSDIFCFNGHDVEKVFTGRSSIISLSYDREGYYWVGYANNGLDILKRNDFKVIEHPLIFTDKSITKVLRDHEGGLWFSSLEDGVYYSSNIEIEEISLKGKIRAVAFNDDYVATGNQQGYVSLIDRNTNQIIWEKDYSGSTQSLFFDNNKQLWISTDETIVVDLITKKEKKVSDRSFTGYCMESDTSILAVGGLRINRLIGNKEAESNATNSIHLRVLGDGSKIYASSRIGLEIFDTKMNLISKPQILSNSKITALLPLDNKLVFIGTIGNGFHLFDKESSEIISFNADKKFIANNVYYAQKTDSLIWMSTELGLLALDYRSLIQYKIQYYGLLSRALLFERVHWFNVNKNTIWAVSDNKIKIIPTKQSVNNSYPIFYYEWIKPVATIDGMMKLNYKGALQLKFGFISFNSQNIYARYRVSQENDWTQTTSRIINLQALSPGEYLLEIEFSLDNERWESGAQLPFLVDPPWWGTTTFLSIAAVLLSLIGFIIYKKLVARYKEKNEFLGLKNEQQKKLLEAEIEATERERSRIAKDLHDGIGMDLVSIKLMTNRLAKKTDAEAAFEIESQLQKTISEIQNIIYDLTPAGLSLFGLSHGIDNYVSRICKNHAINISFDFVGEEIKDQGIGNMIFRIIQELITNSIKHSNCTSIAIQITVSSDQILITYQDNGIGFDMSDVKHGLGLSNIRSRVDSLMGEMKFESSHTGTYYSIRLPYNKTFMEVSKSTIKYS